MAAACLATEDLPDGLNPLLASCNGLPFAIEEMLAAAVAAGELVESHAGWLVDSRVNTAVPASVNESVLRRLKRLGEEARDVLAAGAVLGGHFSAEILPDVAGTSARVVRAAVQQAREVQLIEPAGASTGTFQFRHSLTRQAILSDLPMPDLIRLSARAAAVIEDTYPGLPGASCRAGRPATSPPQGTPDGPPAACSRPGAAPWRKERSKPPFHLCTLPATSPARPPQTSRC